MAYASAALTYQAAGNREDLTDILTNITPTDTPMFSRFQKTRAKGTLHEWMTESLASAAENKNVEGADFTYTTPTARTRVNNYTQIFVKTLEVSATQEVIDKAGLESEFAHRMENQMKEIARDVEYQYVNGASASGASGTARELNGVLSFISTNNETGSGTGTQALTEAMYNDALQTIYAAGGNPDTAYANGWQKRKISSFSTPSTRNVDADDKRLVASVDVYESDFGMQTIVLDRYMSTDTVALLEDNKWATAILRPFESMETAKVADSLRGAIVGELTLECRNEAASGKITQLTTS